MRDDTPGDGSTSGMGMGGDRDPLPAPSQQGPATPQRQMSRECLSAHPAGAGHPSFRGVIPGITWHGQCCRRLPAVPHSWRAGSRPLWGQPLLCVQPPCAAPPGRGGACCGQGQGPAAPLSGGRVQPDKESLLDSGSKQSISGKRWAGEIKAEIPPQLLPHRGVPSTPNRGAEPSSATAIPSPSSEPAQAEPKQAEPSKARFKPCI